MPAGHSLRIRSLRLNAMGTGARSIHASTPAQRSLLHRSLDQMIAHSIRVLMVVVGMTTLPTTSRAATKLVSAAPERPVGPSSLEPVVAPAQLEVLTVVLVQDGGVLGELG